jgi:pimeloyl-ACP methyl ester carboxylesterase
LDRKLDHHYRQEWASPFRPIGPLSNGGVLVALDCQRRLLPLGISGELYLAHPAVEWKTAAPEPILGPVGSVSPVRLMKTGFLGRNGEDGRAELWGRPEDIVVHQGFRLHRLARRPVTAPIAASSSEAQAMEGILHQQLLEIWREILKLDELTIHDNFFDCGGTSFLALRMMIRAGKLCGRPLPLSLLLTGATIANLSRHIIGAETDRESDTPLITLRREGRRPPLFFLHGDWAGGGFYLRRIAAAFGPDQPTYALPPYRRSESHLLTLREMAAFHCAAIRKEFSRGPYILGGYCIGATVAMEMARQFLAEGETVDHLFLVDPPIWSGPGLRRIWPWVNRLGDLRGWDLEKKIDFLDRRALATDRWLRHPWNKKWAAIRRRLGLGESAATTQTEATTAPESRDEDILKGFDYSRYYLANRLHRFEPLSVPATFFLPEALPQKNLRRLACASRMDPARYRIEVIPGAHDSCVTTHSEELAARIARILESLPGRS